MSAVSVTACPNLDVGFIKEVIGLPIACTSLGAKLDAICIPAKYACRTGLPVAIAENTVAAVAFNASNPPVT